MLRDDSQHAVLIVDHDNAMQSFIEHAVRDVGHGGVWPVHTDDTTWVIAERTFASSFFATESRVCMSLPSHDEKSWAPWIEESLLAVPESIAFRSNRSVETGRRRDVVDADDDRIAAIVAALRATNSAAPQAGELRCGAVTADSAREDKFGRDRPHGFFVFTGC